MVSGAREIDGVGVADVAARVRTWLDHAPPAPANRAGRRREALLAAPRGPEFLLAVMDAVLRPADPRVAAEGLERLSRAFPRALPGELRVAVALAGGFALLQPRLLIPAVRGLLRRQLSGIVLPLEPERLASALRGVRGRGRRLTLSLAGVTVLGDRGADRRAAAFVDLVARAEVSDITIRFDQIAPGASGWEFEETVTDAMRRLAPVLERAAARRAFVRLAAGGSRDRDLAIATFTRLLDEDRFARVEAGIVVPLSDPDALDAVGELAAWARERRSAGKAGIVLGLAVGAAPDGLLVRALEDLLTPARTDAVRVAVHSGRLFDLAFARLLAERRSVASRVELALPLGAAPGVVAALAIDEGAALLEATVVDDREFAAASTELAGPLAALGPARAVRPGDEEAFDRASARFAADLAAAVDDGALGADPASAIPNRRHAEVPSAPVPFRPEPDTDPGLADNRAWAAVIAERARDSRLGRDALPDVADPAQLAATLEAARRAGSAWPLAPASARAEVLRRAGDVLAALRGRLVEVLLAEADVSLPDADHEASRSIDAAYFSAERAGDVDTVAGARAVPPPLVAVRPDRNALLASTAESVFTALAAGSGVLLIPEAVGVRVVAVFLDALREAGVPRDVVSAGVVPTALLDRPPVPLRAAEGSAGTQVIAVTPAADLDSAVADLVASAFTSPGRAKGAGTVALLVGSVDAAERFRSQLADAVASVRVSTGAHPAVELRAGAAAVGRVAPGALTVVPVATLFDAIEVQNSPGVAIAGLESRNPEEVARWLGRATSDVLVVNRPAESPGPGRAAGRNAVLAAVAWERVDEEPDGDLRLDGLDDRVRMLIEACQPALDFRGFDRVRRGALSDQTAWVVEFGRAHDPAAQALHREVARYRSVDVVVRLAAGGELADFVRVIAAGVRARARLRLSSALPLPSGLLPLVGDDRLGIRSLVIEPEATVDRTGAGRRLRWIGSRDAAPPEAPGVWAGPVTTAGRIELLPFVREQSVLIATERFGAPDRGFTTLPL